MSYLNRTLRWTSTGLSWEHNVKQVQKLLEDVEMTEANSVSTPITMQMLGALDNEPLEPDEARRYRAAAARLNFLAQDRPDLCVASCVASTTMANPVRGSWASLKRVCGYLQDKRTVSLFFEWQSVPVDERTLILQTDSDWATCPRTRKSRSGGAIWHGAHCVSFWCRTQDRVARSSGEAELKSSCAGLAELLGLRNLLTFLLSGPCKLEHQLDASATKSMLLRQGAGALKHLDLRTLWVQEVVHTENVLITKIPRTSNVADALCSPCRDDSFRTTMGALNLRFPMT